MISTACGLDCYDACKILLVDNDISSIEGDKSHPSSADSSLCSVVNKYMSKAARIEQPTIDGKAVSMSEALSEVANSLKSNKSLLWRGSGNIGVMQDVSNLIMSQIDGTITEGSLCDGAGEKGILNGRGSNITLPLEQIEKAQTIVVWGRNITTTNAHLMPYIKDKDIIVIDPIKTNIAKKANLHIQLEPRTDFFLAVMLSRFVFMEDSEDIDWLEEFASDFEDYYDFTREFRIKSILEYIGTDLGELGRVLELIRGKRVVFLVGVGVQKYSTGSETLQAIDSLAAVLGLFGKDGCGVSYLGDSKLGFNNPFDVECDRVSKVRTPFEDFKTVLVQGGNPAESMPNSTKVKDALLEVDNLIYFGLYENETSKMARVVIPAKNFFEKNDIRLSYGDQYINEMHKVTESSFGISEYDFTKSILENLNLNTLNEESFYIKYWLNQCQKDGENLISPAYEVLPYSDGFGDDEFVFVDEYNDDFINTKRFTKYRKKSTKAKELSEYWLLSPKAPNTINTQFKRGNTVYINPASGYKDNEIVKLISSYGDAKYTVSLNEDIRENCLVVFSSAIGINKLTPDIISNEGKSACYQEVKVRVELLI